MRNLILSTLSTLALLIHPLSLSAQNSFSLSVDVNGAAGDQAVTSLNVSADQVVAIQIFGKDIQNANGLAVRFEYDASQVTYDGFDAGDVLPNAQALPEQGTNPTFVEIGIASLGGQATANSGLVGTVRFRATTAFSGTTIRLVRAELSRGGRFETITPNIRIALQGIPTPANFSLSLDVDGSTGDQAITSVDVSTDEVVAIQIFGQDIRNASGVSIRFEYDASQVTYEGFDAGDVLPNVQSLIEQGMNPTFVEISLVSFGGQATANSGLVGTVRFRTLDAFSGTAIRLVRAELGRGGQIASATIDARVELTLQVLTPDFNRDGMVNFADFLAFGGQYGARQGDGRYDAKYDLDSDGAIGFGDFLIFGNSYGQDVSTPGGGSGGGGGTGSPDLIVESPSVSDSTLTTGQSFTLQATVRNQGSGQAAATTLRYYQSVNATISSSDTRVGSNAIGSLNAPGSSVESISLNAPSSAGTYYYGACVSSVSGESNTGNNCSRGVRVAVSSGGSTTNVDIPDANLRAVIENSLGKASGASITRADMASLTRLEAPNSNISDLTGLEFATGLTSLDLSNNEISDISVLANSTNLTWLNLSVNIIADITPLSGLTKLTSLDLSHNIIADITPLSGLTSLTSLNLSVNTITDISPLSGLTNLTRLRLHDNFFSDISPLFGFTNLTLLSLYDDTAITDRSVLSRLSNPSEANIPDANLRAALKIAMSKSPEDTITSFEMVFLSELEAPNSNISDLTGLELATNLTKLDLGAVWTGEVYMNSNDISDLSPLSGLNSLTTLYLSNNSISDVAVLSNLTNLTNLVLSRNDISDVSALSGLNSLRWLFLDKNSISDVAALSNLTSLTMLYLQSTGISDVSALSGLTSLTTLYLTSNSISDVSALSNLTSLRRLVLDGNSISDVSALSGLNSLEQLWLYNTSISDVAALSNLTSLISLALDGNSISDVSALSALINLRWLYLSSNSISNIAPLVANTGLGSGDEVDVRNNPLSATSLNTHIPALQGRGVDVQFGASKPGVEEIERGMIPEDWETKIPSLQSGSRLKHAPAWFKQGTMPR